MDREEHPGVYGLRAYERRQEHGEYPHLEPVCAHSESQSLVY